MKRSELRDLFNQSLFAFNHFLGTDFSEFNIILEFSTQKNAAVTFEKLCASGFPRSLSANHYDMPGFFDHTKALSILEDRKNGILYITDGYISKLESAWADDPLFIFLHEIAHIVCMRSQFSASPQLPSMSDVYVPFHSYDIPVKLGYYIWREVIADHVAAYLRAQMTGERKGAINRDRLRLLYSHVRSLQGNEKAALAYMLSELLTSHEVLQSSCWDDAYECIQAQTFGCEYLRSIFPVCQNVYQHIRRFGIMIDTHYMEEFGHLCESYLMSTNMCL